MGSVEQKGAETTHGTWVREGLAREGMQRGEPGGRAGPGLVSSLDAHPRDTGWWLVSSVHPFAWLSWTPKTDSVGPGIRPSDSEAE